MNVSGDGIIYMPYTLKKQAMRILALMLAMLLWISPVYASYIALSTTVGDCVIIDEDCKLDIAIENRGDEAAYDVRFIFSLPDGLKAEDLNIGRLDINTPVKRIVTITKTGTDIPGTYPGMLFIEYKDANRYPLSAIVPFNIAQSLATSSPITGVMEEITLRGEQHKKLKLRMKNSADESYNVTVELFVPRELGAVERKKELLITPFGEKRVEFDISSFSALPGSTYPVFSSITHESGGRFYSTFTKGVVIIKEKQSIFSENSMLIVLGILLAIFIFYQVRDRR